MGTEATRWLARWRAPIAAAGLLAAFVAGLWLAEWRGLDSGWILGLGLLTVLAVHVVAGLRYRTGDVAEYYLARRRVPASHSGMAGSAEWLGGAAFIGLAGVLFDDLGTGLAYILGWSGGFVLLAVLFAPYLHRGGRYGLADFIAARFGGTARALAVIGLLLVSLGFVVAQLTAIGLIAARFTGLSFQQGLAVGLAAVLFGTLLGGMRAVLRAQAMHYLLLIVAFVLPLALILHAQDRSPVPPRASLELLAEIDARAVARQADPAEQAARAAFAARAGTSESGSGATPPGTGSDAGQDTGSGPSDRLALILTLMLGTAAMPTLLARLQTAPSADAARRSVFWTLLFCLPFYLAAPLYALLARHEVDTRLIGQPMSDLPAWVYEWAGAGQLRAEDINVDGRLQHAELSLHPDMLTLATPEMAGLSVIVLGLVAAGALAAALASVDGLLLAMANSLARDGYARLIDPAAPPRRQLWAARIALCLVAGAAAALAAGQPDNLLGLLAWALALAAAGFFPVLLLAIYWRRANGAGAVAAMLAGFGVCLAAPHLPHAPAAGPAGLYGAAAGLLAGILISLATRPPPPLVQDWIDSIRQPVQPG